MARDLEESAIYIAGMSPEALVRVAVREKCARSLHYFVKTFWHTVEPTAKFVDGWWLHALCEHLEALADGRLTRLIINCPPGFSKSLVSSVFFPAWLWGPRGKPSTRIINASYSQGLTERDNVRFLQVLTSPLYREMWGDQFTVSESRIKCSNSRTGWKFATSIGGIGTGERGDLLIIDDPNNIMDVESEAVRGAAKRWLLEVMPTRLNNASKSAILVIQQRAHEEDATGVLLESERTEWCHFCVPMRYDPQRHCRTSIGWEDPRTEEGELAWPERFPLAVVERDEEMLGPYGTSGQFQQLPTPRGGGIIPVELWQLWPPEDDGSGEGWETKRGADGVPIVDQYGRPIRVMVYPDFVYTLVSCDTAMTEKEENDWSACTVWGIFEDKGGNLRVMLVEAWRARDKLHAIVRRLIETCKRRQAEILLIEDKANGHAVADEVKRLMADGEFTVRLWNGKMQDKAARLQAVEPLFFGGIVYAPARRWARMVIDEVAAVPKGKSDDLADTVSQALLYLRRVGMARLTTEKSEAARGYVSEQNQVRVAERYGLA